MKIFRSLLVLFCLLASRPAFAQFSAPNNIRLTVRETSKALPLGMWSTGSLNDTFKIEKNTSTTGNFSTSVTVFSATQTSATFGVPLTVTSVTNNLSVFGATTSAQFFSVLSDPTGTGLAVFGTSPTIVTPTIASFTNATHTHQNATGGGTLDASAIAAGTVATARLGSGTANNTTYLRGDQTWQTITSGVSSITGTANQVIASSSTGAVTLSTPQSIATASTPQFARMGLGVAADAAILLDAAGAIRAQGEDVSAEAINKGLSVNRTTNDSQLQLHFSTGQDAWMIDGTFVSTGAYKPIQIYPGGTGSTGLKIATSGINTMGIYGAGTATFSAAGVISSVSDARVKDVQGPFTAGLKELREIQPVLFKYNQLGHDEFGLDMDNLYVSALAQQVAKYIPEAVGKDARGYYSLNAQTLGYAAINAIRTLDDRLRAVETALAIATDTSKAISTDSEDHIIQIRIAK